MLKTRRVLTDFLVCAAGNAYQSGLWQPLSDIHCYDEGCLIKIELAGIALKDVRLTANGRYLCVQGVRRDFLVSDLVVYKGHFVESMEISYNCFERLFEIPFDIDKSDIGTDYRDGMLLIYLKSDEQAR